MKFPCFPDNGVCLELNIACCVWLPDPNYVKGIKKVSRVNSHEVTVLVWTQKWAGVNWNNNFLDSHNPRNTFSRILPKISLRFLEAITSIFRHLNSYIIRGKNTYIRNKMLQKVENWWLCVHSMKWHLKVKRIWLILF